MMLKTAIKAGIFFPAFFILFTLVKNNGNYIKYLYQIDLHGI